MLGNNPMLSVPPSPGSTAPHNLHTTTRPGAAPPQVPGAAPVPVEQRSWPRAPVELLVRVLSHGANAPRRYITDNLSAGGALLVDGPALEVGTEVQVLLMLGRRTLAVRAQVVRTQQYGQHGLASAVRFLDVSAKNQDMIQTFVLASLKRNAAPRRRKRRCPD